MKTQTNEYITITAEEGYFLTNNNGLYGTEIVLGSDDSPENYEELPLSQWPENEADSQIEEEQQQTEHITTEDDILREAKFVKTLQIEQYDVSEAVNGFYYNDQFMWLDRTTRAVLANTINSAEIIGQDTINIWYNDVVCVTLDCEQARYLLASLEMYATECYNVTANHKLAVRNMETADEVEAFDITAGYPERLRFNTES